MSIVQLLAMVQVQLLAQYVSYTIYIYMCVCVCVCVCVLWFAHTISDHMYSIVYGQNFQNMYCSHSISIFTFTTT